MDSLWKTFSSKNKGMLSLHWLWNRAIPRFQGPLSSWLLDKNKREVRAERDSNCNEIFSHYNFWLSLIGILVLLLFFLFLKVEWIPTGLLASIGGLSYDFQVYWNGEHTKNHQEMPLYWLSISWNKWTQNFLSSVSSLCTLVAKENMLVFNISNREMIRNIF